MCCFECRGTESVDDTSAKWERILSLRLMLVDYIVYCAYVMIRLDIADGWELLLFSIRLDL